MQESKFWRIVAVALVSGLFYIGHGLHSGHDALPSLVNTVLAGGAGVQGAASGGYGIFTSSQDGNILYCWVADPRRGGANFVGAAKIDGKFIRAARVEAPADSNTKHAIP
jgi:hypothetical protein